MVTTVKHRKVSIVTLETGERIVDQCKPGDIAITQDSGGWWTHFVGENGEVHGYDEPFDTYNRALGVAKAAAEFEANCR